jgi:hypothetical protein
LTKQIIVNFVKKYFLNFSALEVLAKHLNFEVVTFTASDAEGQRGLNTKSTTIFVFFGFTEVRNLSHHMERQARTADTMLVKSREMTGRTQWLGGEGVKTTENKNTLALLIKLIHCYATFINLRMFMRALVHFLSIYVIF